MMFSADKSITMTDHAVCHIANILSSESEGTFLRLSVSGGGCSGFKYGFTLDNIRTDDDFVIEKLGAIVLIDPVSVVYLQGSKIDFIDDLIGSSFKIINPNAKASCGCGSSFAV
jgi:iron-sulfur cluster assembly accessory protein